MTTTVYLYAIPTHQYSNATYYIGSSWASYLVTSVANVKVPSGLMTELKLPYSSNMEHANVIKIGYRYYDVTDITYNSNVSTSTIAFKLKFNPVCTFLSSSSSLYGFWDRTPTSLNYNTQVNFSDSTYIETRRTLLPCITHSSISGKKSYYYQLISKESTKYNFYGGFLLYDDNIFYNTSTSDAYWCWSNTKVSSTPTYAYMPNLSLYEVINDLGSITGISSENIVNLSISPRCPYNYVQASSSGKYGYNLQTTVPDTLYADYCVESVSPNRLRSLYHLNQSNVAFKPTESLTITLSDYERYCGRISVVDESNNPILIIPNDYFNSSNQYTLYVDSYADISGLYTMITTGSVVYTIPEGQIPWVGDNWIDYRNTSLEYDRAIMTQNLRDLKASHDINQSSTIASTATNAGFAALMAGMGGGSAGATAAGGVGITGTLAGGIINYLAEEESYKAQKKSIINKQKLYEEYVKNSPTNNFQVAYGLEYLHKGYDIGGMAVIVETPTNFTSSDFTALIGKYGYPCAKLATATVSSGGYLQGTYMGSLTPASYTSIEINMLRDELENGVLLVV